MISEWLKYKTDQIKQFGSVVTSGFVPDEIAEQRYNVCLECDYFKDKKCKLCYCYILLYSTQGFTAFLQF